jgi:predicted glycoside hydrolase/deacetylase ChbG (UPF0249 family)
MDFYESNKGKIFMAADDFGISPRANRNILHLIDIGKIDRVGVMINGEISQKEVDQLMRSGVKLDIHLDILHQLDEKRKKRTSATARSFEFALKYLLGKISAKKVSLDWENQIKKFKETFGKNPDGLNSHEHVHFFPQYFKIALRLQDTYSIPYLRFGNSTKQIYRNPVSLILNFLRKINTISNKKTEIISSRFLLSLDWIEDVDNFLDNLPEGTIEIVCHPELAKDFAKIKKFF